MTRKSPTIRGSGKKFTDVGSAHRSLASGSGSVKYEDLVKVMAKQSNLKGTVNDERASPETFDDWDTFRTFYSRQSNGVLFVNSAPPRRRAGSQKKGLIGLETFLEFQFMFPDRAANFAAVFLSSGKEGLQIRENQKRYHPEQSAFALDMMKVEIYEKVDALCKEQAKTGKGLLGFASDDDLTNMEKSTNEFVRAVMMDSGATATAL